MKKLLIMLFLASALALAGCPDKTYETTNNYETKPVKVIHGDPIDNPNPVPEPVSLVLVGSGLIGLAYWRRRK